MDGKPLGDQALAQSSARYPHCFPFLVDDEEFYVRLLTESFIRSGVPQNNIRTSADGEAAINYLARLASSAPAALPSFVILDMRLRRRSGFEVLSWIKKNSALNPVPVVVLTGTEIPSEVARAGDLGVQAFHAKPFLFPELLTLTQSVLARWESGKFGDEERYARSVTEAIP